MQKSTGRSLSDLVEHYLEDLVREEPASYAVSPGLKKLLGAVKLPEDFDEKQELREYLEKKHL